MTRHIKRVEGTASVTDSGTITGYASTFTREPDWVGDVVAKGAFAEWLDAYKAGGTTLPLLYNHDQHLDSYIGKVTSIEEDEHGLLFTADFLDTEKAQFARHLAQEGMLSKFSFAYVIRDQCVVELGDGRKANELRRLDVDEVSLVLMPTNPDTSVVEVKAGRRNSKSDADTIRQAIDLLQGLLTDEERDEIDDADDASEGGEGDASPKGREDVVTVSVDEYRQLLKQAFGGHNA